MPESIVFGGSAIAAVIAGAVALFAPCCISVMLPAYFASSFPNRRRLVAMTFIFAAGIATVILPIALGAQLIRRILIGEHKGIYLTMGALLFGLGAYLLFGGKISLPMPGRKAGGKAGPLGVYTLGLFSGVASPAFRTSGWLGIRLRLSVVFCARFTSGSFTQTLGLLNGLH